MTFVVAGAALLAQSVGAATTVATIRTGVDESNANAPLGLGVADTNWFIVNVIPTNGAGWVPRPAITVGRESGWVTNVPMAGTQIISVGTNYGGATNQWDGPDGAAITFRYQFALDAFSFTNWSFIGQIWADDSVEVWLNGSMVFTSGVIWNLPPVNFTNNDQSLFVDGLNTVDFIVHNSGGLAVGLDFSGSILAVAIPEPGMAGLVGLGLGLFVFVRSRRSG